MPTMNRETTRYFVEDSVREALFGPKETEQEAIQLADQREANTGRPQLVWKAQPIYHTEHGHL